LLRRLVLARQAHPRLPRPLSACREGRARVAIVAARWARRRPPDQGPDEAPRLHRWRRQGNANAPLLQAPRLGGGRHAKDALAAAARVVHSRARRGGVAPVPQRRGHRGRRGQAAGDERRGGGRPTEAAAERAQLGLCQPARRLQRVRLIAVPQLQAPAAVLSVSGGGAARRCGDGRRRSPRVSLSSAHSTLGAQGGMCAARAAGRAMTRDARALDHELDLSRPANVRVRGGCRVRLL